MGARTSAIESLGITPQQAAAELLRRKEMRKRLAPFIKRTFQTVDPGADYMHNWHIDCMAEYLEALYAREIKKLIVNVPPRFLKSIACTIGFPAWAFGQDPSERIIASSGVASLATKHSADCRKVLRSSWYKNLFPDVRLAAGQDAKSRYETTRGGHRIAVPIGGSGTVGEGGRIKIIDDPIDPKKAFSATELDSVNEWYDNVWSTRSDNPKTTIELLVMQRLAPDDLTGHLLAKGGWEQVKLPQVAELRTVITFPKTGRIKVRKAGELLHEERTDEESVEEMRVNLRAYGFAAQQQQEPVARGGNRIRMDWFGSYDAHPDTLRFDEIVQSWDTGVKASEVNDPSVCITFGRRDESWCLLHVFRNQVVYPDLKRTVLNLASKYHPNAVLIEDKASGQQLLQELEGKLPVIAMDPGKVDKVMRMEVETAFIQAGGLFLPSENLQLDWMFDFEQEIQSFPTAKWWDQIDALSQFLKWRRTREAVYGEFQIGSITKASSFRR